MPDETELLIAMAELNARAPAYGAEPLTFEEVRALAAFELDEPETG